MLGSDILLFPDTGPDFLRALKTSILYAQRTFAYTHVISPCGKKSNEAERLRMLVDQFERLSLPSGPTRRFVEYWKFIADNNDVLVMLQGEGVLVYPGEQAQDAFRELGVGPSELEESRKIADRLMDSGDQAVSTIAKAYEAQVPCFMDAVRADLGTWSDTEWMHCCFFAHYLASLSVVAERLGVGLASWSSSFQNALWAARKLLVSDQESRLNVRTRRTLEAALGTVALERYLPAAEDLPFDEVLEIRRKRHAELEGFRVAIRELASQIDPTMPPENLDLAIDDLVSTRIDPAVRNLRSAIYDSRLDAIKKLGQSWDSLAKATVPFVVSFVAGAPLSVSAALALLGPLASALLQAVLERQKLVHASQ